MIIIGTAKMNAKEVHCILSLSLSVKLKRQENGVSNMGMTPTTN